MYLREQQQSVLTPLDQPPLADIWGCQRQTYGGGWSACRHSGTVELIAAMPTSACLSPRNHKRLVAYRYNPSHYSQNNGLGCNYTGREVAENIVRFFHEFEERLGWWDRTHVHPTQHSDVVHVYYSGGWLQNHTSCWLATLVCRIGGYFGPHKTFDWALHQHHYGAATLPAIYRYLDGYTHYIGDGNGWYDVFRYRTWDVVCQMLVDPAILESKTQELAEADQFAKHPLAYRELAQASLAKPDPFNLAKIVGGIIAPDLDAMERQYHYIQRCFYQDVA